MSSLLRAFSLFCGLVLVKICGFSQQIFHILECSNFRSLQWNFSFTLITLCTTTSGPLAWPDRASFEFCMEALLLHNSRMLHACETNITCWIPGLRTAWAADPLNWAMTTAPMTDWKTEHSEIIHEELVPGRHFAHGLLQSLLSKENLPLLPL